MGRWEGGRERERDSEIKPHKVVSIGGQYEMDDHHSCVKLLEKIGEKKKKKKCSFFCVCVIVVAVCCL